MTFGWACRRSTALLSRGITSCVLIWRTGRRRDTGLNISSHWRDLPKNTSFTSPTSLVICLMPWPTAPAWGSLQRTGILMTTKTPTATAVTQVGAKEPQNVLWSHCSRWVMLFTWSTDRWLVGQWLWGNQSEWKVSVAESKRKGTEEEGHPLEACCRAFLLPEDDQDDITASPTDLPTLSLQIYTFKVVTGNPPTSQNKFECSNSSKWGNTRTIHTV